MTMTQNGGKVFSLTHRPFLPPRKYSCHYYESVQDRKRATGACKEDSEYLLDDDKQSECLLNDDNEVLMQQSEKKCAENARAAKNERGCKFCGKGFATVAEVKESQNRDSFVADKYELLKDNNGNSNEAADHTSLCLATTCPNTDDVTSP